MATIVQAKRMQSVAPSGIRGIFERAESLARQGADVIHMELGRPDFDTPLHIKEAAKAALDRGDVHYTSNYGTSELCEAVAGKLRRDNDLVYDPAGEIVVTVGAAEALYLVFATYLNPGDEVLVPEPGWLNYIQVPATLGARAVGVPLDESHDYKLSAGALEERVTSRTRGIVINSPHNPTGAVFPLSVLEAVATLAQKYNLWVISDEIYEHIVYDDHRHVSVASLPGMRERTFVVNGLSKAYSMTGWRVGYVAAPRMLILPLLKIHQYLATCAAAFAQAGAAEALRGPQECVDHMVAEFKRRRDSLLSRLVSLPGVTCTQPGGAFYVFPDLGQYGLTSVQMADHLLEKAHVATVPGTAFGSRGEGHVRISYCTSYERVVEAADRIVSTLKHLSR